MSRGNLDWAEAACAGLENDVFFDDEQVEIARRTCLSCPLRQECLDEAISLHEDYGVRGGLTADERRYLDATRVPKNKLVVAACLDCDEPVTWRLSPIPTPGVGPSAGRFRLLDGVVAVIEDDLRRPLHSDTMRCTCGRVLGWTDDRSGIVGLELDRLTVRAPAPPRRRSVVAAA